MDDPNANKIIINGDISGGTTTGAITLNLNGTAGYRTADNSGNQINGLISNGGAASLSVVITNQGNGQSGAWQFTNNNNSYTGNTSISGGLFVFSSIADAGVNSAIGRGNTLTFLNGAHVKYNGGAASTNRVIAGSGSFYNNGSGAITITNSISSSIIFRGSNNFIIDSTATITGNSGLNRTDGGTVIINNNNLSFTGTISISDGAFRVGSISNNGTNSALGSNGNLVFGQGSGTVGRIEYTGGNGETNRLIVMRNEAAESGGVGSGRGKIDIVNAGTTMTFTTGVRARSNAVANTSDLDLLGAGTGVISGRIGGSEANINDIVSIQIKKNGTGTWVLSGDNTYARETFVYAGILNVRHSNALGAVISNQVTPTAAGAGTQVSSGATLQLQGNISIGAEALSLAGHGASGQTGALVNVSGNNSFGGAITLTADSTISSDSGNLNLTNTTAITGNRALTLAGAGNGNLASNLSTQVTSLTKNGTGIWTLSGTNVYTGNTTINAGTLNVTGSLGTSNVTVANGATLSASGNIGGTVTVANGGAVSMGDATVAGSTGTATFTNTLTLNNNSYLNYNLGTSSDLINANGALTLNGIVKVTGGAGFGSGTYKLIDYTGTFADNGLAVATMIGYNLAVQIDTVAQDVNLLVTAQDVVYWDGTDTAADNIVDGGNGVWTNAANNWTSANGSSNASWSSSTGKIAIFGGVADGTVQVQDAVQASGLQFARNYSLTNAGGTIGIQGSTMEIRLADGVAVNISAPITGNGGINQTGEGTLTLSAAAGQNTYTGSTRVSSGTLVLGATNTLPTGTALILGSGPFAAHLNMNTVSQTVSGLAVESDNALTPNTITIGTGQTLTVNGGVRVGIMNTVKTTTRAVFTGTGNLVVNSTTGHFEVGYTSPTSVSGIPGAHPTVDHASNINVTSTDLSTLSSFTANVNEFRVGHGQLATATLTLSNTSNNITANIVQIGNSAGLNPGDAAVLILGSGINTINANTLNIGLSKSVVSTLRFASQTPGSPGTVVIEGKTPGSEINILVGSSNTTGTGYGVQALMDLSGHTATVRANNLMVGQRNDDHAGGGGANATVKFSAGTFTVNNLSLGYRSANGAGNASGTLEISGGTFTVNSGGSFNLATYLNTNAIGAATGIVTLTGGSLISNVAISDAGGTSTITLNGGLLDMKGNNIGDGTNTINNFNLQAGVLKDTGEINGGGNIAKTTAGTLVMMGNNAYTGNTAVNAGTVLVSNSFGVNSGTGSGSVTVADTATVGGNGRIAGNVTLQSGATLAPGGNSYSVTNAIAGVQTDVGTVRITGNLNTEAGSKMNFQVKTNGSHGLTTTYDPVTNLLTSVSGTSTDGGNDRVVIEGTFQFDPASSMQVTLGTGYTPQWRDVFDLIDWVNAMDIPLSYYGDATGLRDGKAADNAIYKLILPDLSIFNSEWKWDVSQFGTTGVIAIAPEPGRAVLMMMGLLLLLTRRQRRLS